MKYHTNIHLAGRRIFGQNENLPSSLKKGLVIEITESQVRFYIEGAETIVY